ncbi:CoA transferase [Actinocorallia longicatena]|uniref:CoA transferase n=1 Tax=Actinocorallia longicatena TaxID=111803 RepID=A0ABP6Q9F0_9ACTN
MTESEGVVNDVLAGVKVLEVAAWTFVPAAGAVLAEWGAEVVKLEPREGGDPQRGLSSLGFVPTGRGGINPMTELPNRGKKSIGVDLRTPGGREVVRELAARSDVFLTNYLPSMRARLGIDLEDIRAANPSIIYVRGSAHGSRGPDADRPGYDGVSYWSRGGIAHALTGPGDEPVSPRPAFGDVMGGLTIAGGVAAALYKRATTGRPSVVDVSLVALGAWNIGPDIVTAGLMESREVRKTSRADRPNPLVGNYRTKDGRHITLMMLQMGRYFAEAMRVIGLPEFVDDERFGTDADRYRNRALIVTAMDEVFAGRTLEEWTTALSGLSGAWSVLQSPGEIVDDPAVRANGYVPTVTAVNGTEFAMPVNPVQFDEVQVVPTGAPEHGQHTEEILLAAGLSWEQIAAHKEQGAIL